MRQVDEAPQGRDEWAQQSRTDSVGRDGVGPVLFGTVAVWIRWWPEIARRDPRAFLDGLVRLGRRGTTDLEATIRHQRCSLHRMLTAALKQGGAGRGLAVMHGP
jgi:hypothetical protein